MGSRAEGACSGIDMRTRRGGSASFRIYVSACAALGSLEERLCTADLELTVYWDAAWRSTGVRWPDGHEASLFLASVLFYYSNFSLCKLAFYCILRDGPVGNILSTAGML